MWPLTVLYVTDALEKPAGTAGLVLALEAGAGIAGSLAGGFLFDKVGGRRVITVGLTAAILFGLSIVGFERWPLFLLAFPALALVMGILFTSVAAGAGLIWPEGGRLPFRLNYLMQNIGVAAGTAAGGLCAGISFRLAFSFMTALFALALWTAAAGLPEWRGGKESNSQADHERSTDDSWRKNKGLPALCLLGLAGTFMMTAYTQWQATVPLSVTDQGYPLSRYSFLWTLNGLIIVTLQPILTRIDSRLKLQYQALLGFGLFILSFALLALQGGYITLLVSMCALTAGEIILFPMFPAYAASLASEGAAGRSQGLLQFFLYSGRLAGPIAGTSIYQLAGAITLNLIMIGCLIIGFAVLALSLRLSARERDGGVARAGGEPNTIQA